MKDRKQLVDHVLHEIEDWEAKLEPLKFKAKLYFLCRCSGRFVNRR